MDFFNGESFLWFLTTIRTSGNHDHRRNLVHNQLSSPRYINIFEQGWFKSNYIDKKPEKLIILLNLALEVLNYIVKYLVVKM